VARALDTVGERWALLVVRELLLGPKRFTDLRAGLPHVSTDILAARLRELEEHGVVARRVLPPPAASKVYELSARGRELEPVVLALGRWGSVAPFPPGEDAVFGADALVIALMTLYAGGRGRFGLVLDGESFALVAGAALEVTRGEPVEPDGVVAGSPAELAAVLWHGRPLSSSGVTVSGDTAAFFSMFPLP
jgi:DNA-binding HxlR family transcriptional regulator